MDESAFSLICPSWLDLISAETNSRKCFERQRKLAEFSCSMWDLRCLLMFLVSYECVWCWLIFINWMRQLGRIGRMLCIACTLWLDFRNLQASPQFLRDEPPTRKTAYKPRVAVIIHQDLACTRINNQLLVLVLQLVLMMYASQELTRPCTEAEETRGNYLLFPVLWIAFCTLA